MAATVLPVRSASRHTSSISAGVMRTRTDSERRCSGGKNGWPRRRFSSSIWPSLPRGPARECAGGSPSVPRSGERPGTPSLPWPSRCRGPCGAYAVVCRSIPFLPLRRLCGRIQDAAGVDGREAVEGTKPLRRLCNPQSRAPPLRVESTKPSRRLCNCTPQRWPGPYSGSREQRPLEGSATGRPRGPQARGPWSKERRPLEGSATPPGALTGRDWSQAVSRVRSPPEGSATSGARSACGSAPWSLPRERFRPVTHSATRHRRPSPATC